MLCLQLPDDRSGKQLPFFQLNLSLLSWEHSLQMTEREETILPDVLLAILLLISLATWKSVYLVYKILQLTV